MHLVAYGGRDDKLFAGVIAESNFWPAQPYLSDLEYQFDRTLETVACADADNKMNCLRGKSFKELQSANVPSPFPGRETSPLFYWTPCVDGDLLEDLPHVMYEQGKVLKVPVLSGSCTNGKSTQNSQIRYELTQFSRGIALRPTPHSHVRADGEARRRQLPRHQRQGS